DQFVKYYIEKSEEAAEAKLTLERERGLHEQSSSLYRTTLTMSPYYQTENTSYSGSTTEIDSDGLYLEAELAQTSAFGLTLDLTYNEFFNNRQPEKSFALELAFPIFRN